ncbi:MAG TPA: kynureninase [Saprospiraceae bacterium]|nr:kynureninase [Saprospiraceae bacterium]
MKGKVSKADKNERNQLLLPFLAWYIMTSISKSLPYRDQFIIPKEGGKQLHYFCGNSLGLQPKKASRYIQRELDDWAKYAVKGHEMAEYPWVKYHEFLTEPMARVVGAKFHEVVVMNTLSVNLHLMMVSFYRPTAKRNKILIEYSSFPSDRYAVESQIRFHGYEPQECLVVLRPEEGSHYVSHEQIEKTIGQHGDQLALVLIGSVNYYTGQAYPIAKITRWAQSAGACVGFDLAHGAGNLLLNLHEDGPDFAVWCSYKYLNAGPGGLSGCFVHERHAANYDLPRFAGWWGHNKANRFKMPDRMEPMFGAEGWQLSNPPIFPMASLMASLELFDQAGIEALRERSVELTQNLYDALVALAPEQLNVLTPSEPGERGCQLSIQIKNADKSIYEKLVQKNIVADWREPDVIRVAPVPLYNTEADLEALVVGLAEILSDYGR